MDPIEKEDNEHLVDKDIPKFITIDIMNKLIKKEKQILTLHLVVKETFWYNNKYR